MTLKSIFFHRLVEAQKSGAVYDGKNGGIKTSHWFHGAAAIFKSSKMDESTEGGPGSGRRPGGATIKKQAWDKSTKDTPEHDIRKGDKKVAALQKQIAKLKGEYLAKFGKAFPETKSTKEADSASAFAQVTRAGVRERQRPTPEESKLKLRASSLREATAEVGEGGPTKFKVILIQEGMGNLDDAFYYHRTALESAVSVFTGTKIYADHPSTEEEEVRPERSVRDVLGHFENLKVEQDDDDRAMLTGEVWILPGKPFEWARAAMVRTVENAKKFPDKDFVGLSINAAGEAVEAPIDEVLKDAPESAKPKLEKAKAKGIESVRVVHQIKRAVSCDLVTEAGAGGKIINFIEGENANGKEERSGT